MNNNSSSDNVVGSSQRDERSISSAGAKDVGIPSSARVDGVVKVTHVTKVSIFERRNSVVVVSWVVVTSSRVSSIVKAQITILMDVESVSSSQSSNDSINSNSTRTRSKPDSSINTTSSDWLQIANCNWHSGSIVSGVVTRLSNVSWVSNTNHTESQSGLRTACGCTIISLIVNNNCSSNNGVHSTEFRKCEGFVSNDGSSSANIPVSGITIMPICRTCIRASMSSSSRTVVAANTQS
mmetsp:Transcript_2120/g.2819  ORF Transcript_2120/g.2819 Transcript_2120/m.2819 type:complete len:238 (-) Transcript_2120:324-1037(-)